ncbi:ParB/RepB/Spo0J family partition protein, partial [Ruminococcaceae bacterium OttesenSCG-928-D13]|nr:ParB/RepB/Spo0J family partition protein [Ruminococcaceae bacterium OttesenSCG-928-D13]
MKTEQSNKDKKQSAYKGVEDLFNKPADKPADPKGPIDKEDVLLAFEALHSFKDHPFGVRDDEEMQELVASIKNRGLDERIKVRPRKEGGYEIISGHRRVMACKKAGMKEVPATIYKNLDDPTATEMMVDANLHRQTILPSERAKSIKMKMDARSKQGQRGKGKRTDAEIADEMGISRNSVQRLVRLLELTEPLLKMVDEGRLSENPAYELSFLPKEEQDLVQDWMEREDRSPTQSQCMSVKQHSQALRADKKNTQKSLTEDNIDDIMQGERLLEIYPLTEKEKEKEAKAQAEKEVPAPAQAPAGVAAAPPAPATAEQGQEKPGGAPAPNWMEDSATGSAEAPEVKGIPVQFPGGTSTIPPSTSAPVIQQQTPPAAAPATTPEQNKAQSTDAATRAYIRSQCMAEIRTDNIVMPKADVKKLLPNCHTNAEYVAAITAALTDAQVAQTKVKVGNTAPAIPPKTPEPVKVDSKAPAIPPKTPEPPKVSSTA